ncbi:hypothetical protein INS49_008193 [Diaporthe citri]|uniref:uncharacterized protein n=1 Tax=Diaporthe citri TaxID=83186 RepID=UPI001C7EF878|nr:uncharacterized protein INS49_008193 [Diaporthe citri]KAG6363098.1 hypothetical protein INS49_008193 [Diaporthe citri]
MDTCGDHHTAGPDQTSAEKDVFNTNHPPAIGHSLITELQQRLAKIEESLGLTKSGSKDETLVSDSAGKADPTTAAATAEPNDTERGELEELCEGVKVKYTINRQNESGNYVAEEGKAPTSSGQTEKLLPEKGTAMEFIPHISKEGLQKKTVIKVFSTRLRNIIRKTIKPLLEHENCEKIWTTTPAVTSTMDVLILHEWDKLSDVAHSEDDKSSRPADEHRQAKAELRCFLRHIQRYESELFQTREDIRKEQSVQSDTMWLLFPPGSEVVSFPFNGLPQIFTVRSHRPSGDHSRFVVSCWGYDWDGEDLVRYCHDFPIQGFSGKKKVQELPCYPVSFYNANGEDENALRHKLAERGRKFREFCVGSMAKSRQFRCSSFTEYDSSATKRHSSSGADANNVKLEPDSEAQSSSTTRLSNEIEKVNIIVDPLLYKKYAGGCCLHLGNMVPDTFKLCVCVLCELNGLRAKWRQQFTASDQVDSTKPKTSTEKDQDTDTIDSFYAQLPPRVLGFIVSHKIWAQIDVDSIEEEDRDSRDKARIRDLIPNKGEGLVILLHVLLRQLEYFRGILIMTTNRILTIDIAVQSRVHYSVRFREPDETTLDNIWETFTKQLSEENCQPGEKERIARHFKEFWRDDMVKDKVTGRDIRNMFMTAQLLSYPWLTLESLKIVVRSVKDFRGQLQDLSRKLEIQQSITDAERHGGYYDN